MKMNSSSVGPGGEAVIAGLSVDLQRNGGRKDLSHPPVPSRRMSASCSQVLNKKRAQLWRFGFRISLNS